MSKHEAEVNGLGKFLAKYKKSIVSVLGVLISAYFTAQAGDGVVTTSEFANIATLAASTISLYFAPNTPGARYTKSIIAATGAAASLAISYWSGGLSQDEISQIIVAVVTALGVKEIGNVGDQYDRMLMPPKKVKVNNATVQ
jgi:hypothetical protein